MPETSSDSAESRGRSESEHAQDRLGDIDPDSVYISGAHPDVKKLVDQMDVPGYVYVDEDDLEDPENSRTSSWDESVIPEGNA